MKRSRRALLSLARAAVTSKVEGMPPSEAVRWLITQHVNLVAERHELKMEIVDGRLTIDELRAALGFPGLSLINEVTTT